MGARKPDAPAGRVPAQRAGALTLAVRSTLKASEDAATASDAAARALLLVCAQALDAAQAARNPYAVAQLAGRTLETMRALRLTPEHRGPVADVSPLEVLMVRWSTPALRD